MNQSNEVIVTYTNDPDICMVVFTSPEDHEMTLNQMLLHKHGSIWECTASNTCYTFEFIEENTKVALLHQIYN
jgi:hypothetical protein